MPFASPFERLGLDPPVWVMIEQGFNGCRCVLKEKRKKATGTTHPQTCPKHGTRWAWVRTTNLAAIEEGQADARDDSAA